MILECRGKVETGSLELLLKLGGGLEGAGVRHVLAGALIQGLVCVTGTL